MLRIAGTLAGSAQIVRAFLLAIATATTFGFALGQQLDKPAPLRPIPFGVAHHRHFADNELLAQILMPRLGKSAEPLLAAARVLFGTRPIHAARARPERKIAESGTVPTMALASSGPTAGISISRRPSSVFRALAKMSRSYRFQADASICRHALVGWIGNHVAKLVDTVPAGRRHHPERGEMRPQRVQQLRALAVEDQANTVQQHRVLLLG